MKAMKLLLTRRSSDVKKLTSPGPGKEDLEQILTIATRVPDHGKLAPWKILLLEKPGQKKLGQLCAKLFLKQYPDAAGDKKLVEHEQNRFARAPLVIAVLSTPKESAKAPVWEQEMSAGAVCMNILHACHALGYGAKWLSEWPAFRSEVVKALGGKPTDKIAGFLYIGTKTEEPDDRDRPKLADVVSEFR
jgi:nitroreductase